MASLLSIWKSKKGGIPAINELVTLFVNTTPKPILIAIFIILFTTIASFIIPTSLSMFGYTCVERATGTIELYQIPMSNLVKKNFYDLSTGYDELFGAESYSLPDDPFPNGDYTRLRIRDECFISSTANGSLSHGYVSSCVDCPTNRNWFETSPPSDMICVGDGYSENAIVPFADRKMCSMCSPPYPYYFNYTNCINEDACYFTIRDTSLVSSITNDYLLEVDYQSIVKLGGVKRNQDVNEIFNIQCTSNQKPSIYFFSIEMFNRTMWILLIVGSAIVTFALSWYSVVLK